MPRELPPSSESEEDIFPLVVAIMARAGAEERPRPTGGERDPLLLLRPPPPPDGADARRELRRRSARATAALALGLAATALVAASRRRGRWSADGGPVFDDVVRQGVYLPLVLPSLEAAQQSGGGGGGGPSAPNPPPPPPYTEEALRDRITNLPGLGYDPGFNMFSGYLTVSEESGRNIFYWLVESAGDPRTDPIVLWTNGGPGCSGLIGLGQEHGPFHVSENGVLRPALHTWNSVASILYVEQPAGVGFSYSENPDDLKHVGDERAARDNLVLVEKFFERFPEKRPNDFYVASESYGGHYIPQLAKKIVDGISQGATTINFRGFLVGNPWVDPFTNDIAQTRAFYQHGLISKPMLDGWLAKCSDRETYDAHKCPKAIRKMRRNMKDISPYALDFPICTEEKAHAADGASSQVMTFLNRTSAKKLFPQNLGPAFLPPDERYLPCEERHVALYLNQEEVQRALHVREAPKTHSGNDGKGGGDDDDGGSSSYSASSSSEDEDLTGPPTPQRWRACAPSRELSYSDADFLASQIGLYRELVNVAKRGDLHLRMLVFSGDNDSVCSTSSTQAWIYDLGVSPFPDRDWNEWTVNRQTAGFVTHFDLGDRTRSEFIFATVHGAGHEVPAYRPVEALDLFARFLRDEL